MTAESRSTAAARFSMLMPLERSTRPASTEVRRSSHSRTGVPRRVSISSANSRTQPDCRPSDPRILIGLPRSTRPTSRSRMSSPRASRSARLFVRTRFGNPWAVIRSGSLIAIPIRFLPRSSARMREACGFTSFNYSRGHVTFETRLASPRGADYEACQPDVYVRSRARSAAPGHACGWAGRGDRHPVFWAPVLHYGHHGDDHRLHPGAVCRVYDAASPAAQPGRVLHLHDRAPVSLRDRHGRVLADGDRKSVV